MLTVACVYWKGEFRGREKSYSEEWVIKLRNMVQRNLNIEHRFVCLSNVEIAGIETIPLKHDWPGWWSKIELFRSGLFEDRVVYLDLDTMVIRNMDRMVVWPQSFAVIGTGTGQRSFNKDNKELVVRYNTSVMIFNSGFGDILYNEFAECPDYWMDRFRGDQDYIAHIFRHLEILPAVWTEKFRWLENKYLPPDGEVIILLCMSGGEGKTNLLVEKYKWMEEYWK